IESPLAAVALKVQFQRLQFHAPFLWGVSKRDRPEVGLSGQRAEARVFGADDLDGVIAARRRGGKGFQLVGGRNFQSSHETTSAGRGGAMLENCRRGWTASQGRLGSGSSRWIGRIEDNRTTKCAPGTQRKSGTLETIDCECL